MLTISQKKTYEFIKKYVKKNNVAPTIGEIAKGIEIKSRGVVHRYVQALAAEGKLHIVPNKRRNIQLLEEHTNHLLLSSKTNNGEWIEHISPEEVFNVTDFLLSENRYAIKITGNFLAEEGIFDEDIIICERNNQAQTGQIVIAVIDKKTMIVRRYQQNSDETITFSPIYSRLLPQVYVKHQVDIQGILIGLLRLHTARANPQISSNK